MNIQAMMKQAQKLQSEMMKEKEAIDNKDYVYENANIKIEAKGTKKIKKIEIKLENIEKDDIEMLEDMITVGVNNIIDQIDSDTEKNLGKYTQGMPGLF